jgi:alanine racemase
LKIFRPTWAEIDLGRIRRNASQFKRRTAPAKLMAVVKANGYGHGAVETARAAEKGGADWLGVSSVEEGIAIREAGLKLPVLILGSLYPFESFQEAAKRGLTVTVASPDAARALEEATGRHRFKLQCHLKLDTGMGRIGMSKSAALQALTALHSSERARVGGVYTHLACADSDEAATKEQLARFKEFCVEAGASFDLGLRHAANSIGALRYPEARWDLVRPGLALYGLVPGFEPAMSVKTKVVFVKNAAAGAPLGYGATFRTRRASRIATLPIGYADGLPRSLSNRGEVLVGGQRCPIVGSISMDMMLADVTELPSCHVGDEAVVLGEQGGERVTASDLAAWAGTIPYEIVTGISSRVPRRYLEDRP